MEYSIWWTIGGFACLFALGLIVVAPGFILGFSMRKKFNEQLKLEREERNKYKISTFDNGGVLAPAIIVSARKVKSWGGGKHSSANSFIMDFEADVNVEGGLPFRAVFRDELYRNGYTILGNEMITEHGRKIWVIYDPKDTSRVYLDHYDEDHESGMKKRELDIRYSAFNKLTKDNEDLKTRGEQAEAVITRVDDLDLPYPLKKGRAMHLYFNVTPKTGFAFQAEGDFLIGDSVLEKYSVGRKVFVRFDPLDDKKAVLDSERNKSLS